MFPPEKFTNELIDGIKDDTTTKFRNKYRNIDVLLIDDIQFLAKKKELKRSFSIHLMLYMKPIGK